MGEKASPVVTGGSLQHEDKPTRKPDFSGWATKAGLRCSDGRTIMPDAFKHQDKTTVPLVWQHGHAEASNVLGHVELDNRSDGVYCFGYFNHTDQGKNAKALVSHGDIKSLSIFANQLKEQVQNVIHGMIREVSLVMAGANPGALIDNLELAHADTGELTTIEDEAVIYTGLELQHEDPKEPAEIEHTEGPTVQDVFDAMSADQKNVVHYMVGAALEGASSEATQSDDGSGLPNTITHKEGQTMTRNVFEQTGGAKKDEARHELSHDDMKSIAADAVRMGSLKEAVQSYALAHGINNIDLLFPDAKALTSTPEWDTRRMEWVKSVLNGTRHSPFSRIKSLVADLTFDDARAKGYITGTFKKEQFFGLVKRVTTPSTIYKKQKLDRDDIIDITDFDVVMWMKGEMRLMLDEELARAVLIGDGRAIDDEDKIKDPAGANEGAGIRSIANDDDLYAATINLDMSASPTDIVDAVLSNMQFYKGSGGATFYTTLPTLTKLLLARDTQGRRMYRTASDLASEMTISNIVPVEVMESVADLVGIVVNLSDYTIGSDAGGDIAMFDDFDIDYNQYKYLIETRVSGALTKIRSALVFKSVDDSSNLVAPTEPSFNVTTGAITVPGQTGVSYKRADTNAVVSGSTINLADGETLKIYATPTAGNHFANNVQDEWTYTNPA